MTHRDNTQIFNLLKTSRGQLDSIIKMVEEEKYYLDISNQILAAQALLKKVNIIIIDAHTKSCIKEAFENGHGDEKVDEIIEIISKYTK